jgi:hypothetical protein
MTCSFIINLYHKGIGDFTPLRQLTALKYVMMQWVTSHVGIHENEVAGLLAKKKELPCTKETKHWKHMKLTQ